jgi:hypothetical protein
MSDSFANMVALNNEENAYGSRIVSRYLHPEIDQWAKEKGFPDSMKYVPVGFAGTHFGNANMFFLPAFINTHLHADEIMDYEIINAIVRTRGR